MEINVEAITKPAIDTVTAHYEAVIDGYKAENERLNNALKRVRDKIEREADYYDANINTDVAKGLYIAVQMIDKYSGVSECQEDGR